MLTLKEKAISNTFQIIEGFKLRKSPYTSPVRSRAYPKAQPSGKVKIFTLKEIQTETERRKELWKSHYSTKKYKL